ncbi:EFh [Musa troglodytarum]|uniref:EFh n=1 Tax=Musa troglodytarum TaxID=320322 RepID=A0A9E7FF13_9LILI|nr:EFh [Musa troglodytarum]
MAPPQSSHSRSLAGDIETLSYVNSMMEAFRAFDSNNDGLITCDELRGIMASLGYNPTTEEVREMMRRGDADKDGLLSMEEFLEMNAVELDPGDLAGLLQTAAALLGPAAGDDGDVTAEILFQVLSSEVGASLEDCTEIIASLDADGDGAVSFEDFKIIAQALR